jgi:hypothetical protein
MEATVGTRSSRAGKPVTASIWALAIASGCSPGEALAVQALFGKTDALFERRFVLWWQETTLEPLPPGSVVAPAYVPLHHEIMERMTEHFGTTYRAESIPESPLLPCRTCGRLFRSCPPRFARRCYHCNNGKPYLPRAGRHRSGASAYGTAGFYTSGPSGPAVGWSVMCGHPDCATVFPAVRRDELYCPAHSCRMSAKRARDRSTGAKHERFVFYPPPGSIWEAPDGPIDGIHIQCTTRGGSQQELLVTEEGYLARDDTELAQLARLADAGQLILRRRPST